MKYGREEYINRGMKMKLGKKIYCKELNGKEMKEESKRGKKRKLEEEL